MEETEILRRTFSTSGRNIHKILAIIFAVYGVTAFLVGFIIAARWHFEPYFTGYYMIGFGQSILGAVLASIFLLLYLHKDQVDIVLTDKRLYIANTKNKGKTNEKYYEDSILLTNITGFHFFHDTKTGARTLEIESVKTMIMSFHVDEEFYKEFIKALKA